MSFALSAVPHSQVVTCEAGVRHPPPCRGIVLRWLQDRQTAANCSTTPTGPVRRAPAVSPSGRAASRPHVDVEGSSVSAPEDSATDSHWQFAVGINAAVVSFISMEAAQAMTGWAREGPPPFLNGPTGDSPISVGPVRRDRSAEERFESEAMPHLNDLFRTALRMTGERGQAEDVIQEVYLQAWRSFENFEAGTNCRAWLYKILFHCVSHHRRKWFRFPLLKEKEEFLEANLVQPDSVSEHVTDSEILKALDEIPAEFRSVVLLADVEEFAYKEVAGILSIPIGTVMSRLSRGRALLRKRLVQVARSYGIGKSVQGDK